MAQLLSPLTQTPYPDATDNAISDLLEVPDAVLNLEKYVNLRFASAAARDAAIPVPVRGMCAVIGSTAANSYVCWYDGSVWRGGLVEQPAQDAGFPVAASGVSAETVLSRITVPARDYARQVTASGTTYLTYTQANDCDLIIYAGVTVIGRTRYRTITGAVGTSISVTSAGGIAVAGGASVVLELRAVRSGGTGAFSTSVSSLLTTFAATVTPV